MFLKKKILFCRKLLKFLECVIMKYLCIFAVCLISVELCAEDEKADRKSHTKKDSTEFDLARNIVYLDMGLPIISVLYYNFDYERIISPYFSLRAGYGYSFSLMKMKEI